MKLKNAVFRISLNLVGIALSISFCLASAHPGAAPPSWNEHFDLLNIIVGFLFVSLVGLVVYLVRKIDANQTVLFDKLANLSKDFYILDGEHRGIHGRCPPDRED